MSILTFIFLLPLLAAIALAFVPRNFAVIIRLVAVIVTFVVMLLAIAMFCRFGSAPVAENGYRFVSTVISTRSLPRCCSLLQFRVEVGGRRVL